MRSAGQHGFARRDKLECRRADRGTSVRFAALTCTLTMLAQRFHPTRCPAKTAAHLFNMYYTVVALMAVGLAQGHVIPAAHIASQYHAQDELGQYSYGYSGGPSAKHEVKTADGVTRGAYSYVDGNGLVQSASYVSDPLNGFRVAATNLPAAPAAAPALVPAAPALIPAAPALIPAAPALVAAAPAVVAAAPAAIAAAPAAPAPVVEANVESDDTAVVESAAPAEPEMNEQAEADSTPAETPAEPAAPVAAPESPMPVNDTPEVAQAKIAHNIAVEETKARDAATAARDAALAAAVPVASLHAPIAIGAAPAHIAVAHAPVAVAHSAIAVGPAPVAVAHAPVAVAAAPAIVGHVASQYHAQDELGQYTYGYAGGPSAKHETKTYDGITQGGYSYVDANGLVQSAAYVSDPVNGFRVAATNLPVQPEPAYIPDSPEVAEAKSKLFQAQAEHIAKL
jgi:hypothetical protein